MYEYDKNRYDPADKNTANWGYGTDIFAGTTDISLDTSNECGLRLAAKHIISSVGDSAHVKYNYGNGHLSGVPIPTIRYFLSSQLFKVVDYGANTVEYEFIEEVYGDGSRKRRVYYEPGQFQFNKQAIFESKMIYDKYNLQRYHLVLGSHIDWKRGQVRRDEAVSASGQVVSQTKSQFYYKLVDSVVVTMTEKGTQNGINTVLQAGWVLRQNDSTYSFDQYGNLPIPSGRSYQHNSYGLVTQIVEGYGNGLIRKKHTEYFVDDNSSTGNTVRSRHLYTTPKSESIYQNDTLKSYAEYAFSNFASSPDTQLYLSTKKEWQDVNANRAVDSGELITTLTVPSYDSFGNPRSLVDANGVVSNLEWSGAYQNSLLTKRIKSGLSRTFTYNRFNLVQSILDENGVTTTYEYDGFGRVIRIIGPNGEIQKEISYNFQHQ